MKRVLIIALAWPLMSFAQTSVDLSQYFDEKSLSIDDSKPKKTVHCDEHSSYYPPCDGGVKLGLDLPRLSGGNSGITSYDPPKTTKETS